MLKVENYQDRVSITFALPDGMSLGGVTTWSVKMCEQLAQLNRRVVLLEHTNYIFKYLNITIPPEVSIVKCPGPTAFLAKEGDLADYLSVYRSVLPSIVLPNWSSGTYATCALMSMEVPEALRVIGFAHSDEDFYYEWLHHYEPIIHTFVAVSREVAAGLRKLIPHRKRDILERPYAVSIPPELERNYSPPARPVQLVYAGRIDNRQKRTSDLVRLIQELEKRRVNFHLRIIGDGVYKQKLWNDIQMLNEIDHSRVSLEGSLLPDQMLEVWKSADICILVSNYEGTSISMLEAMAWGCVPVVTRVSGTSALIKQGVNGFTVPVGDMEEMAHIIKTVDSDRKRFEELGAHAYASVKHFSYEEYIPWFLNLVDHVWKQPPRVWPAGRPLFPPEKSEPGLAYSIWRKVRFRLGVRSRLRSSLKKLYKVVYRKII